MGLQDRPLAFLSGLANLDLDPKTVAKAVENMIDIDKGPAASPPDKSKTPRELQGPRPEDITRMLQSVMAKASSDPSFAALLGSLAEEGMRSNMLPKLIETLGAEIPPQDSAPERQG